MRQLTFVKPGVLEWHGVPAPGLDGPRQAIAAPVAATTCDLDRSLIKGRAPHEGPIALGHEFVARVVDVGDAVRGVVPGDTVAVPTQISCGDCDRCRSGSTAFCRAVAPNSTYGLGAVTGSRGGAFSDLVRVPFADGMLVRLPDGVSPPSVAAASDNLTNAFEAVVPLSLLQMVLRGVRLEATPMNIRAFLPEVLSLVRTGRIVPERVTTEVLSWETLPEALVEPSTKPVFVR